MISIKTKLKIRKAHRYLGLFLGIQFLLWTVSGLYFSWTNIDEIHGDDFKNIDHQPKAFSNFISLKNLVGIEDIFSVELRDINNTPYYWINNLRLYNAIDGEPKDSITKTEALYIANAHMKNDLNIESIDYITEAGAHHEYRKKPLPAYVVSYESNKSLKAYISVNDGKFQTVRFRDWRWFDFLWMTHTMDYEGRDNFNNLVLRIFSALGLITVLSGFLLWYTSSRSIQNFKKKVNRTKITGKFN